MMKHRPLRQISSWITLLLTTAFLSGCAGPSAAIQNASKPVISKSLSLDFILIQTSSLLPATHAEQATLADAILSGLNQSGLFHTVTENAADAHADGGVKVSASILQLKRVSDDARVWAGGVAGRARVLVQVTVTDLNSGNVVETFQVEGQSGKSAFAGTTDQAIDFAASQITSEVIQINALTAQ
jgi:Domain of unknown function (DUF4410)